jgi:DNA-binding protein Fis
MNQRIDLNEEFRQWLSSRLNETLGNDVENCDIVDFDLHQAREDHFWMVYDYIRSHKWDAASTRAAKILNIRRATVYDKQHAQNKQKIRIPN